jgi:hypothetical protein
VRRVLNRFRECVDDHARSASVSASITLDPLLHVRA